MFTKDGSCAITCKKLSYRICFFTDEMFYYHSSRRKT